MPRIVEFEGRQISVPDDATDSEVAQILSPSAAQPQAQQAAPVVEKPEEKKGFYPGPGYQGAGRAAADLVGMPFDITNMAMNALLAPTDYVSRKLGGPEIPFRFGMVSDRLANAASGLAEKAGIRTEDPEKMPLKDRALYEGNRFGIQGLMSALGLAKAAATRGPELLTQGAKPQLGDAMIRPYVEDPMRAVVGDTAAGFGAGTALAGERNLMPENVREKGGGSVGAIGDLLAMMVGAHGAGTISRVAGAPEAALDAVKGSLPAKGVSLDPETGLPVRGNQADRAAKVVQGQAIDPDKAAETIDRVAREYRDAGLPVPTTGIISGDTGLEGLERGQRTKQSTGSLFTGPNTEPNTKANYSFGERDADLRDAAVNEVNSMRPKGAEPEKFTGEASAIDRLATEQTQAEIDAAAKKADSIAAERRAEAEAITALQGQGGRASTDIDSMYRDTRSKELTANKERYQHPDIEGAQVPVDPLMKVASDVKAQGSDVAPLDPIVQKYVDRFTPSEVKEGAEPMGLQPGSSTKMSDVNRLRAELEGDIAGNKGNGAVVSQLRKFKDATAAYSEELAQSGNTAALDASTQYKERVRPNFRQGAGGEMDRKLAGNSNIRPSETAETFLTRPEDAKDLMNIAKLGGNEAKTAENAKTWLFDRLSQTGVVDSNGVLNADRLTRWRNVNGDLLDQVPGLRGQVDDMVTRARNGETLHADATTKLNTAEANAAAKRTEIDSGPLGLVLGKDPSHAVQSVFSSGDPVKNMRELRAQIGKNPEAEAGLKAAVADHLSNKVLGVDPKSETGQSVSFSKLSKEFEKNAPVLSEIFSPEEMNALRRAQKALEPLSRRAGQATVGSQTAENAANVWRPLEVMVRTYYGALEGGSVMKKMKLIAGAVLGDDSAAVNKLVARSMFDPELASTLLTRDVKEVGGPAWNSRLQKAIRRVEAGKQVLGGDGDD